TADGDALTTLYRNDGGTLESVSSLLPDVEFGSTAFSDVDNDGDLDVALCGVEDDGTYFVGVFANDGSGVFTPIPIDGRGVLHCSMDWGDYDGDGFDDLLVTGHRIAPTEISAHTDIYRNGGGTQFRRQPFDLIGLTAGTGRLVDVDADGTLDIILNGGTNVAFRRALATIYKGGSGTFRRLTNLPGTFPGALSLGDMDRDGDADLAIIGLGQDRQAATTLYLNAHLLVNERPSSPSGLQSEVSGGTATLQWEAAEDATTPAQSLTYNLRTGTVAGANDIKSVPLASDGGLVRTARGNVVHNTSWSIRNLPNGTYFWAVQAIDNGLAASAFSAEASFQVTASTGGKPVGIDDDAVSATELRLLPVYPNPVADLATLTFELPRAGHVRIDIFDVVGRRIDSPVVALLGAGRHSVDWGSNDDHGHRLASGVYVVRLQFEEEIRVAKMAIRR
ncbi:MAG: T9SS type A sorting domain-containing protein, partial [Rhodothermales bacterium]|nr:T9SS type A sorting domain-containing protein [Rhodothermales bacterium]